MSVHGFLDLACLTYSRADAPERFDAARALLAAEPDLAEDIAVAAVLGRSDTVARLLAKDPSLARRPCGSRACEPLWWLAYGRVHDPRPGESVLAAARALLSAGADPDAHAWFDDQYRFTALTGVLGEGEAGPHRQPPHPDADALVPLFLDAGARADEGQGLYNRMFSGRWDHLPPLLARGLGPDTPANWRTGPHGPPSPFPILSMLLDWDADHGHLDRARVLLEAGVPASRSADGGATPWRRAFRHGDRPMRTLLEAYGAVPEAVFGPEALAEAILAADEPLARTLTPGGLHPGILAGAVLRPGLGAVDLALALGVSPNERDHTGVPALHHAAWAGRTDVVERLLRAGADRAALDARFNATAEGWARHNGQAAAAEILASWR